jgi:Asp/Glu/hydantoin racemase
MTDLQSAAPRSLALIHTVAGLISPFDSLARQHLPGWTPFAMLDESLLRTTIRDGRLSLGTMRRMTDMVWSAVDAGAEAVIVTCSSLGQAVEAARPLCPVPLFRIDQGMAVDAVRRGPRIGILATLSTTLDPTADLIRRTAEAAGKQCTLTSRLADGAFALLAGGDTLGHDRLVAEAMTGLAQEVDVIVLAQASMARALETVKGRLGPLPVLTSPELGMAHIAGVLAG